MSSSVEQLEALKAKAEAGGLDMDSTDMENQIEQARKHLANRQA